MDQKKLKSTIMYTLQKTKKLDTTANNCMFSTFAQLKFSLRCCEQQQLSLSHLSWFIFPPSSKALRRMTPYFFPFLEEVERYPQVPSVNLELIIITDWFSIVFYFVICFASFQSYSWIKCFFYFSSRSLLSVLQTTSIWIQLTSDILPIQLGHMEQASWIQQWTLLFSFSERSFTFSLNFCMTSTSKQDFWR